jgi:hypothetical protein
MPELIDVFEMVTERAEPDPDGWKQQEVRQRRVTRNRRVGAFVAATAIAILAVALIARALPGEERRPASPGQTDASTSLGGADRTTGLTAGAPLATFSSTRYGYSIGYPRGWAVRPAKARLSDLGIPNPASVSVDYFLPPTTTPPVGWSATPILIVAAQRLDRGTSLREWTSQVQEFVDACSAPGWQRTIRVGGERANLAYLPACDTVPEFKFWTTIVHGRMGYHVIWNGFAGNEARDQAGFDRVLGSLRFTD